MKQLGKRQLIDNDLYVWPKNLIYLWTLSPKKQFKNTVLIKKPQINEALFFYCKTQIT